MVSNICIKLLYRQKVYCYTMSHSSIIFIHRKPTTSISELLASEETAEPSPFI